MVLIPAGIDLSLAALPTRAGVRQLYASWARRVYSGKRGSILQHRHFGPLIPSDRSELAGNRTTLNVAGKPLVTRAENPMLRDFPTPLCTCPFDF